MRFSKLAQSLFRGWGTDLTVSRSIFKNSISPIRISAAEGSKMKPVSSRIVHREQQLVLRETIFDFCTSLTEDGGALFLDSCELTMTDVEFIHAVARNGGGIYAVQCKLNIETSSFFKCNVKKSSGAILAKECDLVIKKTYFVQNSANEYGAIFHSNGEIKTLDVYVYENSAVKQFGAIGTEESYGQIISTKFKDNQSPSDVGGTSIYVASTHMVLAIEACVFAGEQKNYITYPTTSQTIVTNCCFDVVEADSHSVTGAEQPANAEIKPDWLNQAYIGQCTPPPKLPPKYYREIFHYPRKAPVIEWWKLYIALAIFIVMLAVMGFSVPAVFFPLVAEGATRRGTSKNEQV